MRAFIKAIFSSLCFSFFILHFSFSQENDAGLWLTASVEKKLNKDFKVALTEEFRFKENYSQLGTYFTDVSLQYKISKSFNASFNYRFIKKLQPDLTYQTRNRFYLDIAYRYKAHKWNFILRTRLQDQLKAISIEEQYSEPEYYWRNKLSVKYSVKKFTPYITGEIFYPLNNPKGNEIDEWRWSIGSDYDLNKKNTIGGYFLIDKEIHVNNPLTSFIIGLEYGYVF
ncbi:MAG: DUF2490 domain-containing protein [Bacteroidia bacterium]